MKERIHGHKKPVYSLFRDANEKRECDEIQMDVNTKVTNASGEWDKITCIVRQHMLILKTTTDVSI